MARVVATLGALARDVKVRSIAFQVAVAAFVVLVGAWLVHNTLANLATRGITVGFDFLSRAARFPISQSVLPYEPTDTFAWAFVVGVANTLFVSFLIVVTATALGLLLALARRSRHPLADWLATTFVETMRNTPLVVQLLFWYALVTVGLPHPQAALEPLPGVFLTDRGLYLPLLRIDGDATMFFTMVALGFGVMVATAVYARKVRHASGRSWRIGSITVACIGVVAMAIWWSSGLELSLEQPQLGRFNFRGGIDLTPEFAAMFAGLVLYSAAFIGEIIRGGIDAVSLGQWEAGRALALSEAQTLRLIVMPQALRVIIPPLTSQYINVIKNTTLALVVGYPELAFVTSTVINQTGQAVEGILILMLVYLVISLAASWLLNLYNRRIAIVTR
jgi:general L-amino acid transport system permease protein